MRTQLSEAALSFSVAITGAIERAGGFDLVEEAERDPASRQRCSELLDQVGVWDLRPREDPTEREAAAAACRVAGSFALPYPVAERLSGDISQGIGALAPIGSQLQLNMGDLPLNWAVGNVYGQQARVVSADSPAGGKLGPFVSRIGLDEWHDAPGIELAITLQCWVLLGMIENAANMTYAYLQERHQFGKPLASFQALQFRITDAAVATKALEELAKYTLWSIGATPDEALTDALALRMAALEAAELVFRISHQMHGAIGFCDETHLSWLSRHSLSLRRLPFGVTRTEEHLLAQVKKSPLAGPFAESSLT